MKTASIEQLPMQWPNILNWVTEGEKVEITDHDKTVARVLPPAPSTSDFLARAQAIWGSQTEGTSLSTLVVEARATQ